MEIVSIKISHCRVCGFYDHTPCTLWIPTEAWPPPWNELTGLTVERSRVFVRYARDGRLVGVDVLPEGIPAELAFEVFEEGRIARLADDPCPDWRKLLQTELWNKGVRFVYFEPAQGGVQ